MTTPHVRLDDLIGAIDSTEDAPLDRLSRAVALAEHLDEVADSLIGHFVDQARRSGASWSEIGRSMGVTKQAAQKRFVDRNGPGPLDPSQGFSRFTDEARAAVVAAQERAREAGNAAIGVPHLVLGLLGDPAGTAARAITAQGVAIEDVARTATATLPPAADAVPDIIPFDAHARAALERTFAEAQRLGAEAVGGEHLLLAVLLVEDGTGVLAGLGVRPEAVEAFVAAER
ncbi:Clp protease N-terminal domain-containing protein [Georgenia thermotolerans]|uniref:ATP-dependent Clp protease ATP-binding subunit n=1 Tax=Georgenia thermotolerans TaxID=527326 RepID=A0A7J5UNS3_9MICO|nr:Clp protease N-terminal domain-containing protein [Georgenia thermotolerans]KAE8763997.1 ATP-dependent Clp protease ATP-binding subunit [Georgenia thermotolerans]